LMRMRPLSSPLTWYNAVFDLSLPLPPASVLGQRHCSFRGARATKEGSRSNWERWPYLTSGAPRAAVSSANSNLHDHHGLLPLNVTGGMNTLPAGAATRATSRF
jgi:hypothetical protein